jgi:hypothetical protein
MDEHSRQPRSAGARDSLWRAARLVLLSLSHTTLLAVAVLLAGASAWILGWRLLADGPPAGDTLYQLHLARWIEGTFPSISWWYPWDASGMSYRMGYPTAGYWLAVLVERWQHLQLTQVFQLFTWLVNPMVAVGIYAYCALRMRLPHVGLGALVLYLISPLPYTNMANYGLWANQVGVVLVMPSILALDVFAERWHRGERDATYRFSAIGFCGLTSVLGLVSPALVLAPAIMAFAYVAAVPGRSWRVRGKWLLATVLLLTGAFALSLFWVLPLYTAQAVGHSRTPPAYFSADDISRTLPLWPLQHGSFADRLVPEVWMLAVVGGLGVVIHRQLRAVALAAVLAFVGMSWMGLYQFAYQIPLLHEASALNSRSCMVILQSMAPILAAYALLGLAPQLALAIARRFGRPVVGWMLGPVLLSAGTACLVLDLYQAPALFGPAGSLPYYGPIAAFSFQDPWGLGPLCNNSPPPNRSDTGFPACRPCLDGWNQLRDIHCWRPWRIGCYDVRCVPTSGAIDGAADPFPRPPLRTIVDIWSPSYLMAFHALTGGSQVYTYNSQLIPSPELDASMLWDSLDNPRTGANVEANWAWSVGADSVMLNPLKQPAAVAGYRQAGWSALPRSPGASAPIVLLNPRPSGLAASWGRPNLTLVVGTDQTGGQSHPYDNIYATAMEGMLPPQRAWLVRGRSPYIDDYSVEELSGFKLLVLQGYRYRDQNRAMQLLSDYVRAGGDLYLDSGWQFVTPDWDSATAPSFWPVEQLSWARMNPRATVTVMSRPDPSFPKLIYQGAGWAASGAPRTRPGAQPVISVDGRVLAARWQWGRGRVLWSGMNLIAHLETNAGSDGTSSDAGDETRVVADQFDWLLGGKGSGSEQQRPLQVHWQDNDAASVDLTASNVPTAVLFRETLMPGWGVSLVWPGGQRELPILDAGQDFMLVSLDHVPAGSKLVYRFQPSAVVRLGQVLSVVALLLFLFWLVRPGPLRHAWAVVALALNVRANRWRQGLRYQLCSSEDDYE